MDALRRYKRARLTRAFIARRKPEEPCVECGPLTASVIGATDLPVSDRDTKWDGSAAAGRVFDFYDGDPDQVSRAFLWRDPDADPATQAAYKLGFADVVDDRLTIIPAGVFATAGGRGVDATKGISDADKGRIKARICTLYDRIEDAPDCPFEEDEAVSAAGGRDDVIIHGVAVPLGEYSGDGRAIMPGAVTWDLSVEAVPLIWDQVDGDHTGAIVGVLDHIEDDGAALRVSGRVFDFPERDRLVNLIENNAIGWSVALDNIEAEQTFSEPEVSEEEDGTTRVRITREQELLQVHGGMLRHLALVDTPAFASARPVLGPPPALAAAAMMHPYPAAHFERWESREPTPLQVTADGRVWGHAAGDGCYRNGNKSVCQKYKPDPDPAMKNFHTASLTLDNGEVIRVGSLTCAALHADPRMSHQEQRQHHENTSTVWARVIAWNDSRGRLCVSGSVVPGLDPALQAQVAGMPVSVELWPVAGTPGVTLVGAHTVVTPAWAVV